MRIQLLTIGLIGALAASAAPAALADKGYQNKHWDRYDNRQRYNNRNNHRSNYRYNRNYRSFYGNQYWRGGRYYAPPRYNYNRYNGYWGVPSAFIGGALIGSSLNYSRYHDRDDHRYCDHSTQNRQESSGCYRVERLPDGRERRVELPRSACY